MKKQRPGRRLSAWLGEKRGGLVCGGGMKRKESN